MNFRAGRPAFGELEPYAGKLARTVLRGAWGWQRPLVYSTYSKDEKELLAKADEFWPCL